MATLHDTTVVTKKIGIWIALGIAGIFFLIFFFRGAKAIKNFLLPPGPPPPTAGFGRLNKISFPKSVTDEKLVYSINTISGVLPSFGPQLKVYNVGHGEPSLLNLNRAKNKVANVGFRNTERKQSDNVYAWNDGTALNRTIIMNTISFNFDLRSQYTSYPPIMNGEDVPDETAATNIAKGFLESMGLLTEDIDITKTNPELYTLKNGILIPASSLSTTQVIRVDFFQKDIDDIPMVYPHPPHSTINFLVAGTGQNSVVEGNYFYQPIGNRGETYPIKKTSEAFQELTDGKGYIGSFFGTNNNVKITDVTLGYYLADQLQDFLQPVFIFHGDNDFLAYVPAITDDWLK